MNDIILAKISEMESNLLGEFAKLRADVLGASERLQPTVDSIKDTVTETAQDVTEIGEVTIGRKNTAIFEELGWKDPTFCQGVLTCLWTLALGSYEIPTPEQIRHFVEAHPDFKEFIYDSRFATLWKGYPRSQLAAVGYIASQTGRTADFDAFYDAYINQAPTYEDDAACGLRSISGVNSNFVRGRKYAAIVTAGAFNSFLTDAQFLPGIEKASLKGWNSTSFLGE